MVINETNILNSNLNIIDLIKTKTRSCTDDQIIQLQEYVRLLLEWNQKINLISRNDELNIWSRHIIISLSLLFEWELKSNSTIIDIGTGGGLPGLPIAIFNSSIRFILVDSIKKKCLAVRDIVERMSLTNVQVVNARVEEMTKQSSFVNSFDYILARAVAPIDELIKWSKPLLKKVTASEEKTDEKQQDKKMIPPGSYIFWKGGDIQDEINRTQAKYHPTNISVYPLIFEEPISALNPDKKIVIIIP